MGEVYLAEDTGQHRRVTLKMLSGGLAADDTPRANVSCAKHRPQPRSITRTSARSTKWVGDATRRRGRRA
jgi:hypothetical protein